MSIKVVRIHYAKRNPALDTEEKIELEEGEIEVSIKTAEERAAGVLQDMDCGCVVLDINHPEWRREKPLRLTPDNAVEIAILLLESARAAQAVQSRWDREFPELQKEIELLLDLSN